MKLTAEENTKATTKYPYFGKGALTGMIVFFTKHKEGVVVFDPKLENLGYQSSFWHEDDFTPFYGTITIEKD